tara:strand:- start:217 stop:744 length:528 start_codon:yes stop_codon:yes gene_type:complete
MKFKKLKITDQFLIKHYIFKDKRGSFKRSFCLNQLKKRKINFGIKQGNISENLYKGTLRGFHYQSKKQDAKIITCISGAIFHVTIDVRKKSKTYLQISKNVLSSKNKNSLIVPGGCANAFLTLEKNTIVHYYMNQFYNPKNDKGFKFDDSFFKIKWPIKPKIISKKDKSYTNYKI